MKDTCVSAAAKKALVVITAKKYWEMSSTETDASAMSNKTLGSKLDDLSHGKRKAEVSQGKAPRYIFCYGAHYNKENAEV